MDQETSIQSRNIDGYTESGCINGQRNAMLHLRAVFPKSNAFYPMNQPCSQWNQAGMDAEFAWMAANRIAWTVPDTLIAGDYSAVSAAKSIQGLGPSGIDYRGKILIGAGVEASEMGWNAIGPTGGYTATQIFNEWENNMKATHGFWEWGSLAPKPPATDAQTFNGPGGVLEIINNNTLSTTACPSAYVFCNTN